MKTLTHRKRLHIPDWLAIALIFLLGTALIVFVVYKFHLFIEGHISEAGHNIKTIGSNAVAFVIVFGCLFMWYSVKRQQWLNETKSFQHKTY